MIQKFKYPTYIRKVIYNGITKTFSDNQFIILATFVTNDYTTTIFSVNSMYYIFPSVFGPSSTVSNMFFSGHTNISYDLYKMNNFSFDYTLHTITKNSDIYNVYTITYDNMWVSLVIPSTIIAVVNNKLTFYSIVNSNQANSSVEQYSTTYYIGTTTDTGTTSLGYPIYTYSSRTEILNYQLYITFADPINTSLFSYIDKSLG